MLAMIRSLLGGPAASASVEEAASLMASGATLVDVREHSEWQSGHAEGAIHIPLGDLQSGGEPALVGQGGLGQSLGKALGANALSDQLQQLLGGALNKTTNNRRVGA